MYHTHAMQCIKFALGDLDASSNTIAIDLNSYNNWLAPLLFRWFLAILPNRR